MTTSPGGRSPRTARLLPDLLLETTMAEKTTKVLVKVPMTHPFSHYRRAGLALSKGDNVVEVTDEQLKALKGDRQLLVGAPPAEAPKPPTQGGQGGQGGQGAAR